MIRHEIFVVTFHSAFLATTFKQIRIIKRNPTMRNTIYEDVELFYGKVDVKILKE